MKKYWETAPDAELETGRNILKYWKSEGKLQVSMPYWQDADGNTKQGKTVTINLEALRESDGGIALLERIIADFNV